MTPLLDMTDPVVRARVAKVVDDYIARRAKWWDELPARRVKAEHDRRMKAMG